MSIWKKIGEAIRSLVEGKALSDIFQNFATPPERKIGFTIAVIALSAKMAKADGTVTRDEVMAFRQIFTIPDSELDNAARVFNLARRDVAGFEIYAARIAGMFETGHEALSDLLEGLFYIAVADGSFHPAEDAFLARVAEIFGFDEVQYRRLRSRLVAGQSPDPHDVLGVEPGTAPEDIRRAWRQLVRDNHPDRLLARGLPEEAVKMAEQRLIRINRAYEQIGGRAA